MCAASNSRCSAFDGLPHLAVRSFSKGWFIIEAVMREAVRLSSVNSPLTTEAEPVEVSLPGWIYHDRDFFELEKEAIFRNSWQVVCHISDVPRAGDYHSFDFLGESVIVVRGEDGEVRGFHNVCRHRASRLLEGPKGHCGKRITCGYHAWTYALDGRLIGVPQRGAFRGLDVDKHGLAALDLEVFMGFIFVRFAPGLPSVREMAAPYSPARLAAYKMEELVPQGRVTLRPRAVNWKNVADNYSDGLHINVAHPGLTRLFGHSYGIEAQPWIDKMWGTLRDVPSPNWSGGPPRGCCLRLSTCRLSGSVFGPISNCGPILRLIFIPIKSTSCSFCRCRRPRQWCARSHTCTLTAGAKCAWRAI